MKLITYLKFLSKSTNQHGVHSPFVYNLVTKCFYDKNDFQEYKNITKLTAKSQLSSKKAQLLFRLERYFDYKNVLIIQDKNFEIAKILEIANPKICNIDISDYYKDERKLDLIYLETTNSPHFQNQIDQLLEHIHNDSLLLIDGIYSSSTAQKNWNLLKNYTQITVTIDTFDYGFAFLRKEQLKEHFVIRL